MQCSVMKNGSLSSCKLFSMLFVDMEVGAAQVMMTNKIPVMTISTFVFNSFAAIMATSARSNVTPHSCWIESHITKLKRHSSAAAVIPTVSRKSSMDIST